MGHTQSQEQSGHSVAAPQPQLVGNSAAFGPSDSTQLAVQRTESSSVVAESSAAFVESEAPAGASAVAQSESWQEAKQPQERPAVRRVRRPEPIRSSQRTWTWTSELLTGEAERDAVTAQDDLSQTSGVAAASFEDSAAASASAAASSAAATVVPVPSSPAAVPASTAPVIYFDDDADDDAMASVDVDALVAAAAASTAAAAASSAATDAPATLSDVIDLTGDGSQEWQQRQQCSMPKPPCSSDMEDLAASWATPPPLALRGSLSPPLLFVTDFSGLAWCEVQTDLSLRLGKRAPPPAAQAVMDRGSAIHLEYELETSVRVDVAIESKEDVWALRLCNLLLGLQELQATGRTRELPIFGCVRVPCAAAAGASIAGVAFPRFVWLMGMIDEVVRLDLHAREQHTKQTLLAALVASEAEEKKRKADAKDAAKAAAAAAAPALKRATSDKRKRDAAEQADDRQSKLPFLPAAAAAAPSFSAAAASEAASEAAAADSAAEPSAPSIDDSMSQALSVALEEELRLEQAISAEVQVMEAEAQAATIAPAPSVAAAASQVEDATPPAAAASIPPPPAAVAPSFLVSSEYLVLDHKTRASNSLPLQSQKIATYVQVSLYKRLLDRWLGPPVRATGAEEKSGDDLAGLAAAHALEDDEALQPPFPLSRFFSDFNLNRSVRLGSSVQTHLRACGLSADLTLEDLLQFTLGAAKSLPRTHRDMKVEYEWQRDQRFIGCDTYAFDGVWLEGEIDSHLNYWLGRRAPEPVPLSDGFKCTRCDYADACDFRVVKYQRVGKLKPKAAEEDEQGEGKQPPDLSAPASQTEPSKTATPPANKRAKH